MYTKTVTGEQEEQTNKQTNKNATNIYYTYFFQTHFLSADIGMPIDRVMTFRSTYCDFSFPYMARVLRTARLPAPEEACTALLGHCVKLAVGF